MASIDSAGLSPGRRSAATAALTARRALPTRPSRIHRARAAPGGATRARPRARRRRTDAALEDGARTASSAPRAATIAAPSGVHATATVGRWLQSAEVARTSRLSVSIPVASSPPPGCGKKISAPGADAATEVHRPPGVSSATADATPSAKAARATRRPRVNRALAGSEAVGVRRRRLRALRDRRAARTARTRGESRGVEAATGRVPSPRARLAGGVDDRPRATRRTRACAKREIGDACPRNAANGTSPEPEPEPEDPSATFGSSSSNAPLRRASVPSHPSSARSSSSRRSRFTSACASPPSRDAAHTRSVGGRSPAPRASPARDANDVGSNATPLPTPPRSPARRRIVDRRQRCCDPRRGVRAESPRAERAAATG